VPGYSLLILVGFSASNRFKISLSGTKHFFRTSKYLYCP